MIINDPRTPLPPAPVPAGTPVVTAWRVALPMVFYACPVCASPREITIDRWEKGGLKECGRCREVYHLPPTPVRPEAM